ncbi:MAG TPA: DUF4347 domain-containing protein [Oculatellaceae cyanobacterium]|jgi:hypothetical protein
MPATTSASYFSIVIIDPTVADYESLIAGIQGNPKIFLLNPEVDGITQITSIIASRIQASSLEIISHSSDGNLYLRNTSINQLNIGSYQSHLNQWINQKIAISDRTRFLPAREYGSICCR